MTNRGRMIGGLALLTAAFGSAAGATSAEVARVVVPNTDVALSGGTRSTPFSLALPRNAACAADSALGDYRVQSYMVPADVNPATLSFGSTGPRPTATGTSFRQPLYTLATSGYVNAQTANADAEGEPGAIVNIPAFSLAVFNGSELPDGTYNVGVACTLGSAAATDVEKFWNARIVVGGLRWSVAGAEPAAELDESPVAARGTQPSDAADATDPATRDDAPIADRSVPTKAREPKPSGEPPTISFPILQLFGLGS